MTLLVFGVAPAVTASADVPTPENDPFYAAPAGFEDLPLGTILRTRQVDISLEQVPLTAAEYKAYQLLYRTGDVNDRPIANVTTVVVPTDVPPAGGRELVSLQDAENSLDLSCAPSYQLQVGESAPGGQRDGNLAVELTGLLPELATGRVLVIPDPEGPDLGYIVRLTNAHMVLDSIRAAESFAPAQLAGKDTKVALFGYSGGAFETAAANELQPSYAPELNIVAVTAGGVPVADTANIRFIDGTLATGTLMAVAEAINHAYPQLDLFSELNDAGTAFAKKVQTGCASAIFAAPLAHFDDWTKSSNFFALPRVQEIIAGNALGHATPTAPTFYYNAIWDEIIWIAPLDALVADYCAAGATIDYYRDPAGAEHIQGAANFIPLALAYMDLRFADGSIPSTCGLPQNATPAL